MENVDRFIVWLNREGAWHSCISNSDNDERGLREKLREPLLECEVIWTIFISKTTEYPSACWGDESGSPPGEEKDCQIT